MKMDQVEEEKQSFVYNLCVLDQGSYTVMTHNLYNRFTHTHNSSNASVSIFLLSVASNQPDPIMQLDGSYQPLMSRDFVKMSILGDSRAGLDREPLGRSKPENLDPRLLFSCQK